MQHLAVSLCHLLDRGFTPTIRRTCSRSHIGTGEVPRRSERSSEKRFFGIPSIHNIREFMALGDDLQAAMRNDVMIAGDLNYDRSVIAPLIGWASSVGQVLDPGARSARMTRARL